jgi:crotonobetainyl-CoA:carnitine CoA-transferase CaiB-like acyl-CoA transferase
MSAGLLQGVKILDLSRLLPGPMATLILRDLGAEVIKVEGVEGGDWTRFTPPLCGSMGAYFTALNRGKKSIAINLKEEEGRAIFRRLVERSDIVVESFRPGVMERLGLGYDDLIKVNPRLIYCAITGYGRKGPYRDRAGHDLNYLALSGFLSISGQDPEKPAFPGGQVADIGGGSLYAVIGILASLYSRERTGRGNRIEVPMAQGVMSFAMMHLLAYSSHPEEVDPRPGRMQLNGGRVNYQIYPTRDHRWVTLAALEPKFWENFCQAIGRPDLLGSAFDPAIPGEKTFESLVEIFRSRTLTEWGELNNQYDFCCEPVLHFSEVIEHPVFRPLFHWIERDGERYPACQLPLETEGIEPALEPPPRLGEHTLELLEGLGIPKETIQRLRDERAISFP